MPRFIQIQKSLIHVPSLANVLQGCDYLGTTPKLTLVYQNFKVEEIFYKFDDWKSIEKDYKYVYESMQEVEQCLSKIPRYQSNDLNFKVKEEKLN
jgi:hypothetical protein